MGRNYRVCLSNMKNDHKLLANIAITPENVADFSYLLNSSSPVDIAECIESKPLDQGILLFNTLSSSGAVHAFEFLSVKAQKKILNYLPTARIAPLLNAVSPDDRTALLESLPFDMMNSLIKYLSPEERAVSIKLLGYPEESVGRLMTPDYIAIGLNWTVREVLDYIREKGRDSETINVIYAIDDHGKLVDDFRIREFLLAPLDIKAEDLANRKYISLHVDDDEQKAINVFRKYDRVALPVIDSKGILLGIVTFDDIMKVATKVTTEDMQRIGGVEALKEPYMQISFFDLMQKRVGWLLILFIGEMLTASAMGYFEGEISKAVVLALFVPLIISSGGNAGSQASSLIIRALALGEVHLTDWWRIMRRELFSGLFLGCILGTVGFFRVILWSLIFKMYGAHWLLIAFTVFFSLIGVVLWGSLSGAMLPMALKRCGFDPAVSSAPFVATLVDVTGLIIYFTVALIILQGTLL